MNKETKKCPFCGEEIMATAKKCKHCGEWLENKNIDEPVKTINCSACGEKIDSKVEICPHCGERNAESNSKSNLIIKLIKAPIAAWANVVVFVDGKKYLIVNGGTLELNLNNGYHKITCEPELKCVNKKSELNINLKDKCIVSLKYDRMTGKIKLKEGEIMPDNMCCIIGFLLSLIGALVGVLHIIGMIVCIVGLCQISKTKEEGKGFGIAGIVIAIVAMFIGIFSYL